MVDQTSTRGDGRTKGVRVVPASKMSKKGESSRVRRSSCSSHGRGAKWFELANKGRVSRLYIEDVEGKDESGRVRRSSCSSNGRGA